MTFSVSIHYSISYSLEECKESHLCSIYNFWAFKKKRKFIQSTVLTHDCPYHPECEGNLVTVHDDVPLFSLLLAWHQGRGLQRDVVYLS
jgi:hypothetical protein